MLVVAGGDATPLLEPVERPLDDVALLVVLGVVADRAAAAGAALGAVAGLVGGLGDDRGDASSAQMGPVAAGGVRLVPPQGGGAGPWSTWSQPRNMQGSQQRQQLRAVPCLTRRDGDDQRPAAAIDQRVGLGRQPTAGPADAVVPGLVPSA